MKTQTQNTILSVWCGQFKGRWGLKLYLCFLQFPIYFRYFSIIIITTTKKKKMGSCYSHQSLVQKILGVTSTNYLHFPNLNNESNCGAAAMLQPSNNVRVKKLLHIMWYHISMQSHWCCWWELHFFNTTYNSKALAHVPQGSAQLSIPFLSDNPLPIGFKIVHNSFFKLSSRLLWYLDFRKKIEISDKYEKWTTNQIQAHSLVIIIYL